MHGSIPIVLNQSKNHFILVSMYLAQSTNCGHFPDQIGILEVLAFEERGKPEQNHPVKIDSLFT